MRAAEVFALLPGTWDLDRRLEPAIGTMRGTATFTASAPDTLVYRESGELRLADGFVGEATRGYRYVLVDPGPGEPDGRIDVLFAEDRWSGGLMHALRFVGGAGSDIGGATGSDVHHCGPDDYVGVYAVHSPDLLVVTMDVRGPAKDHTIVTRLTRRG